MPFHVEISSGFRQRARAFNLDEASMYRDVLEPWLLGRRVTLGEKDFEPKDSRLVILEGPDLADTDLSMGRGWSNAEKVSENVTRRLVDAASAPAGGPLVAVLADGSAAADAQGRMRPDALAEELAGLEGKVVVSLKAGNELSGAFDPL